MRFLGKTDKGGKVAPAMVLLSLFFFWMVSCNTEENKVVDAAFDPEKNYTMKATEVNTLISDSGITRYRLNAKEWFVFEKAKEPYWYFPEKIYVEKFDTLFHTEASIKADTAYYYTKPELWELIGNVEIESLQGEHFETSRLFWSQKEEKVYSSEYIRIEQADKIVTGIGFESNQDMTQYKIFDSQGIFPVEDRPMSNPVDTVANTPE